MGINKATVTYWKKRGGSPSPEVLQKVAQYFNPSADALLELPSQPLVTEDALSHLEGRSPRKVLNQWTFQARMYNAARYVCTQPDMQVIQLVSFGCGTDAITTDEMRDILEQGGKLYTQLKIDDINNLGAVKIRIRSLMAAIEARKAQQ